MSALLHTEPRRRPAPDAGHHRPSPPLRLVPPRPKASWVGVLLTLVVAGVLAVVALQAQAASAAFEARALEREVLELRRSHEQLVAEVAELGAPDRLRRIAVDDLGMVPPRKTAYLDMSADGRLASAPAGDIADPVKQALNDR